MKTLNYIAYYTNEDRRRHYHKTYKGRVIEFVIQYETKVGERWFPVVRFDASHGFPHRDLLDAQGNVEKQRLSFRDYNEALAYAEADINLNWMKYKRRLIKGVREDD